MINTDFHQIVWQKSRELYRDMPWRRDTRPYYVLVSELMLQQTQVERVMPKFNAFIHAFPDEKTLASASLAEVLTMWQGLGYNRRAKFLHEAAKQIIDFGAFPATTNELMKLPGVGVNTAGAIMAYSYNQPVIFVETNIRSVYFHHFFKPGDVVDDKQIITIMQCTIDSDHPREWYWGLMDYGSWLKKQGLGRVQQSKHYAKQAPLKGSVREVRGQIVKALTENDIAHTDLITQLEADARFDRALASLLRDGLVTKSGEILHLTK